MTEQQDSVSKAIKALEAVVDDSRLSTRTRFMWRKVLIEARRLAGTQLRRGRPIKFDYREVYDLVRRGGTPRSIADRLGCSVETVRRAIRRVRSCPTPPVLGGKKGSRP
jgi:hypothetical protein